MGPIAHKGGGVATYSVRLSIINARRQRQRQRHKHNSKAVDEALHPYLMPMHMPMHMPMPMTTVPKVPTVRVQVGTLYDS